MLVLNFVITARRQISYYISCYYRNAIKKNLIPQRDGRVLVRIDQFFNLPAVIFYFMVIRLSSWNCNMQNVETTLSLPRAWPWFVSPPPGDVVARHAQPVFRRALRGAVSRPRQARDAADALADAERRRRRRRRRRQLGGVARRVARPARPPVRPVGVGAAVGAGGGRRRPAAHLGARVPYADARREPPAAGRWGRGWGRGRGRGRGGAVAGDGDAHRPEPGARPRKVPLRTLAARAGRQPAQHAGNRPSQHITQVTGPASTAHR